MASTPTIPEMDPAIERRLDAIVRKLTDLTDERAQLVLEAHAAGASLREIAAHAGMTHTGIKKLIGRHLHPAIQQAMDEELADEDGPTE